MNGLAKEAFVQGLGPGQDGLAVEAFPVIAEKLDPQRIGERGEPPREVQVAGRLGSLVTDAVLGDHGLICGDHACLLKAGKACG